MEFLLNAAFVHQPVDYSAVLAIINSPVTELCHLLVKRNGMARQRKTAEQRKDYHLRVPLTPGQRALIEDAARLEEEDKAGWARAVLVVAAKRTVAKNKSGNR
jgi:hypothetical protein